MVESKVDWALSIVEYCVVSVSFCKSVVTVVSRLSTVVECLSSTVVISILISVLFGMVVSVVVSPTMFELGGCTIKCGRKCLLPVSYTSFANNVCFSRALNCLVVLQLERTIIHSI